MLGYTKHKLGFLIINFENLNHALFVNNKILQIFCSLIILYKFQVIAFDNESKIIPYSFLVQSSSKIYTLSIEIDKS